MTQKQLKQIRDFSKKYYKKTDQFHDLSHIKFVLRNARKLAKQFKNVKWRVLEAACYLHDIGRTVKDEEHPAESVKIATSFMKKISISKKEIDEINHAIISHHKDKILESKTLEAKLLFDADKLEILSVYGFLRVWAFLIEQRKMKMNQAMDFLWKWILSVKAERLQTNQAKRIVNQQFKVLREIIFQFKNWQKTKE